ncbi:MAG: acetyl-CoA carboxylase biotin carboxylase subunit [Nitrospirae bacterium]|nr:acetyl-CoA carboxylase biotin carboxylase subunit [Nitrospirota bacterium]
MFEKVLIANRGEIALRVLRACRELRVKTVMVYSEADRDSVPVLLADEKVCIGPPDPPHSYLSALPILAACQIKKANAVHPGYGFLAENSAFAEVCESYGITFIGPSPETMSMLGDKIQAKKAAARAGVPTVPGTDGKLVDDQEALRWAGRVGYPVILKAKAGGGGRGMAIIRSPEALATSFAKAHQEAQNAFGDGDLYLEKYLERPRHIEVQILGTGSAGILHLFERDCSLQRRHQKVIEEAPSPSLSPELKNQITQAAVAVAREAKYVNAGTVEFLVDASGRFYFIEANTRLQVEHPVTESITGRDLVQAQIRIAARERVGFGQNDLKVDGHSIECRINAEDPVTFAPCPGTIAYLHLPGGPHVRVDTAVTANTVIWPHYDPLVAKIITHAPTRPEAINIMKRALSETVIVGIKTNIPFLLELLDTREFRSGEFDTTFIDQLRARRG